MAAKKSPKIAHDDHTHEPITRLPDGTIELTFNLPWKAVDEARTLEAEEMGKSVTVPGFRKGMAPLATVMSHLPADQLLERALSRILPIALNAVLIEHKIRPAIYPKFELLHAHEGEEWTIKATTCELPEFKLSDFTGEVKKGLAELPKDAGVEDKQNAALVSFGKTLKINVPRLLIEEEANGRLGNLLTRIEKLGLTLESYLASQKKTAPELRAEYEKQAEETLTMELGLMKLSEEQKMTISDSEIEAFIQVAQLNPEGGHKDPEGQKAMVKSVLTKRKAIEFLSALA